MCPSDAQRGLPNLPTLGFEAGKFFALIHKEFPNLPNLPNLFHDLPHVRACTRARARTHAHKQSKKMLGRLGRLGRSSQGADFGFPTSKPRVGRLGRRCGVVDLEQMRADFPAACQADEWSVEDQADIGAAIKAAIAANDAEALAYWAGRITDAAARWRAWCDRVRAAEASIKAAAERKAVP